ncbi:MAG: hypothetical protein NAG76_15600 [Candidatus Pristimantibacillus lignocellulolyticus]|uniref:WYL domain-containing protein n=1 Tax=Candidatus Pristimantibacillus lignocellulolyticus TaxID=2994561 RepID=A0A9J6ZB19_9BACL|nr:MAG: hypothetical protein NAG76_15600 [Candidatus Pristimantibacillus lignocellulolyticus]
MQQYIGKIVQLIYVDSKKNVSIRNIKILVAGEARFMAYCYKAREVRSFSKSGVVDIEVLHLKNASEVIQSVR